MPAARDPLTSLRAAAADLAAEPDVVRTVTLSKALGEPALAVPAQRICAREGAQVGCLWPPPVPAGGSCLRLTARAGLTEPDFTTAARALAAVRDHCRTASPAGRK